MNECVGRVGCFTTKLVLCMSICFTHGIKLSILNDHFQSNVMPEYIVWCINSLYSFYPFMFKQFDHQFLSQVSPHKVQPYIFSQIFVWFLEPNTNAFLSFLIYLLTVVFRMELFTEYPPFCIFLQNLFINLSQLNPFHLFCFIYFFFFFFFFYLSIFHRIGSDFPRAAQI